MQDVCVAYGRISGSESDSGAVAHTIASVNPVALAILPVDDADVYIESVKIWVGARVGTHNDANHIKFFIKRGDNDGSLSNSVELSSEGAGQSNQISPTTIVDFGIDQNQVIPKGKVFYLHMTKHGTITSLALDGLSLMVRYRRKA
jgi:hypothetical protein